ncbi:hypothetical protein CGRA01v4_07240 [Colletotrichum graminicola]|nr:hypothetical protein CGRA01v4_07240 [Colletotrichum graminicola]
MLAIQQIWPCEWLPLTPLLLPPPSSPLLPPPPRHHPLTRLLASRAHRLG